MFISEEEKDTVLRGMSRYGGGFVQALAEALRRADSNNTQKIKETWPEYWQQYLDFGKKEVRENG